jgi:hypothetical protein
MNVLPDRAGIVTITFAPGRWPLRHRETITLPSNQNGEFYPLMGGEQFLFHQQSAAGERTWFGGTDEAPFLTELQHKAFQEFLAGGEKKLYEALRPIIIRWAEQKWGLEKTLRQGDIFAYPLPAGYGLKRHGMPLQPKWKKKHPRIIERTSALFSTRHLLTGRMVVTPDQIRSPGVRNELVMIGAGLLEAPDHAPVELPGLHLLAQTRHLTSPKYAD